MENTTYNKIEMEFELIAFFNSIGIDNIYKGTKEPELQKEYKGENFVFKSETSHHLQTDIDLNKIKKALNNKYDFELKKDKFLKWDIFLMGQINDLETFAKESPQIQKDYFKLIESCKRAINEVKNPKKQPNKPGLMAICIAAFCENKKITDDNYIEILRHYKSEYKSKRITDKVFHSANQITAVSDSKKSNTQKFNQMILAKGLLSGKKNKDALNRLNGYIATFEANIKAKE